MGESYSCTNYFFEITFLRAKKNLENPGYFLIVLGSGLSLFGTSGRTRTDTLLRAPDFESGASTNSATLAKWAHYINEFYGVNEYF